jgi:hypothetical protein
VCAGALLLMAVALYVGLSHQGQGASDPGATRVGLIGASGTV